jgi:hypothetical protein
VSPDIGSHLSKLDTLVLINNHIATLGELDNIASCKCLRELALLHNPVTKRENYRSGRTGGGCCHRAVVDRRLLPDHCAPVPRHALSVSRHVVVVECLSPQHLSFPPPPHTHGSLPWYYLYDSGSTSSTRFPPSRFWTSPK